MFSADLSNAGPAFACPNTPVTMTPSILRKIAVIACASLTTLSTLAQTPAAADSAADPKNDETIRLSPFEVKAENNRGYIASESMTGSRVATPIRELPFSVNVLTSEFFDDFALFELNDNVAYIGSFTGLDQGGGFNLRGFNASAQLRDGFFRLGRYGSSNVDRIEVIKGPNAAIYGQTSPGGMLNMISKKPRKNRSVSLSGYVGSYDTNREVFEATGPIGALGDTSYITTIGFYERGYETPMATLRNKEGYVAVDHKFSDKSSLLLQAEYFSRVVHSPTSSAPYILNDQNTTTANDDKIVGIAKELGTLQQFGTKSELIRSMTAFTGTYEKAFNTVLSARVSGNYFRARRWDFNQNVSAPNVNQRTLIMSRGATPNRGFIFEDGGGVQADMLAHYFLGNRAVENRTLLTFDFNDYYRYDPNWNIAGADLAAWTPIRNITVSPDLKSAVGEIRYLPVPFDFAKSTPGRRNKNRTRDIGALLRHTAGFIDGKLLVFGGGRVDRISYSLTDLAANRRGKFTFTEFKPNLGTSYAVTPNLRVYANYSESFFPNQQFITAASITPDYQSETADGYDYGFKGTFLDDRLNFTATAFRINRQNVVVQELDLNTGLLVNRPEGNQLVQGFELDLNWRMTDELSFGGSYGYVDSKITEFGVRTMSIGRSAARVSPQNGGVYLKYEPRQGALRGFSTNIGVVYQAETPTEGPDSGDTYSAAGVFLRSTDQWSMTVPAFTVVNVAMRYTFAPSGQSSFKHTLGLNVNNVADKFYLQPNRQVADRRSIFVSYKIAY
jgi:iron complex outermembrane receptor protein